MKAKIKKKTKYIRDGISYEDVSIAARKLTKNGHYPTQKNILEIIGSGSNTVISKYLKAWKMDCFLASTKNGKYKQGYNDAIRVMRNQLKQAQEQA